MVVSGFHYFRSFRSSLPADRPCRRLGCPKRFSYFDAISISLPVEQGSQIDPQMEPSCSQLASPEIASVIVASPIYAISRSTNGVAELPATLHSNHALIPSCVSLLSSSEIHPRPHHKSPSPFARISTSPGEAKAALRPLSRSRYRWLPRAPSGRRSNALRVLQHRRRRL
jgi:hypothetical protein